ncbi:MAG TPA: T9SS type A sorting domain-containing protein, partial [Bacteroidales bacterium]|nr:T9SS type A sorting domain-containing protein [Bacteroidales bacterium]
TVLQTSLDIDLIEVDQKNKKIYFTEDYTGTIKRCNTDGTELETIITGTGLVLGMALDTVRDILFYGDYDNKKIFKAKPDGTSIVEIYSTDKQIFDLYIDIKRMYVYFNNRTNNSIHRIFYDGSDFTDIIQVCTNNCVISSLAVSVECNFLFWVERENDLIARATTNGEDKMNIIYIPGSNFSGMDIGKEYLSPVKVDENKLKQIKLYPNPCSNQFFVDGEINSEVSIYNLYGQKLKTSKLTYSKSIDVDELPAGIYFVEVKNENDVFKQKIQVAK